LSQYENKQQDVKLDMLFFQFSCLIDVLHKAGAWSLKEIYVVHIWKNFTKIFKGEF